MFPTDQPDAGLVQRLAVSAATGRVAHPAGDIPLRTLTRHGKQLPSPARFLTAVGCPLDGAQPEGWEYRVLTSGRALVLIDGLNEVPERERDMAVPELSEEPQLQLLQRLAHWLIRNGRTELDRDRAESIITEGLPAVPAASALGDAAAVLRHFLVRTGLLIAPSPDAPHFVHRTFQDYLGARAAVEAGVLAMACLEHATELDPAMRTRVQNLARRLLPPRTVEEARELALAGPRVWELLPGPEGLSDEQAEAVTATAALVGTDAAVPLPAKYASHPAQRVRGTLMRAWEYFDSSGYADEVLARVDSDDFYVPASSRDALDACLDSDHGHS
ncbi:NACHT domain-containing protein [Streptomyces sp. NPDC090119]|uniref:NACHT domain-containing protein n=1 Tax=Streptomyces sp. NPDC090119 TaxID=3365951 RepID=UPI003818D120